MLAILALGIAISICRRRFLASRTDTREHREPRIPGNDVSIQSNPDNTPQMRENAGLATFTPRYFPEYVPAPIIQPPAPCALQLEEETNIARVSRIRPPGLEGDIARLGSSPPEKGVDAPIPSTVAPLLTGMSSTGIHGPSTTETTIANPASEMQAHFDAAEFSSSHYAFAPPANLECENNLNPVSPSHSGSYNESSQTAPSKPVDTQSFP